MSRRYLAFAALFAVLPIVPVSARDRCVIASGKITETQRDLLNAFDPKKVQPTGVTAIGEKGVFRVFGADGTSYVVRFPAKGVNFPFEGFAAELVCSVPGLVTPQTRQLTAAEAKAVAAVVRATPGVTAEQKPSATASKASVALFLPVTKGDDHLAKVKVSGFLRDYLTEFARAGDEISPLERNLLRSRFSRLLEEGTKEEKQSLLEDLQTMSPRFKGVTLEKFDAKAIELLDSGKPSEIAKLATMAEQNLTPDLRTQLANYWAVCTVLGIKDFHRGNWMLHDGQVILIDVAEPSNDFTKGTARIDFDNPNFPYRIGLKPPDMTRLLLKNVSPETKAYLLSLTPEQIQAFAKKAGYELTPVMLEGVQARARLVAAGG